MVKVLFVFGTRPEAIKLAPVIMAMKKDPDLEPVVVLTAQHRNLLDQVLSTFSISVNQDLNIMKENQDLMDITVESLKGLNSIMVNEKPVMVVVQGDTTTAFAGALTSFYRNIPLAHIEAGLRSGSIREPFPEEANRILTGILTNLHFAPTSIAKRNLLSEGISGESILVTGNTVIDALKWILENTKDKVDKEEIFDDFILLEVHRRESWGSPMKEILLGIKDVLDSFPYIKVIFPVHPNPKVKKVAEEIFSDCSKVKMVPPQSYENFVRLIQKSRLIITDSGGIQEEVTYLKKPLVLTRRVTERPEGVETGFIFISGLNRKDVYNNVVKILNIPFDKFARIGDNPFGDGMASQRVIQGIKWFLGLSPHKPDEFKKGGCNND